MTTYTPYFTDQYTEFLTPASISIITASGDPYQITVPSGGVPIGFQSGYRVRNGASSVSFSSNISIGSASNAQAYYPTTQQLGVGGSFPSADWVQAHDANFTNVNATVFYPYASIFSTAQFWLSGFRWRILYSPPPNAPSLISPSGTVGTLTPVFTVGPSNPSGGDTITHTEYEVRRVSTGATVWSSGFLSGTSSNYGGSALQESVQYQWRARNRNSFGAIGNWSTFTTFTPSTNTPPTVSTIAPSGTIGTLTPTISFQYSDAQNDVFTNYQIQLRPSGGATLWDTGEVITSTGEKSLLRIDKVYNGPALTASTVYEWRARVKDGFGFWSNYSSWISFTPQLQPNAPSLTSPSELINTLTPPITGTYSQGGGQPEAAFQYEIRQNVTTIYQSGDVATPIATGQTYGTNNPSDTPATPPALAWGTSYSIRVRSKDTNGAYSAWSVYSNFNTNAAPTTPTNLNPNGAILGETQPSISWTHNDPNGDPQEEAEIELRVASSEAVVTGYGPKVLTQATTQHTVTEVLTADPATEYKYRIRTRATAGPGYSPWSAWTFFTVSETFEVTLTSPTASQVFTTPQIPVTWTFDGGSGTQQDYRVVVYTDITQQNIFYDTGIVASVVSTINIPTALLSNGLELFVKVILRDTLNVSAESTLVRFTTAWTPPPAITGLNATAVGEQNY